MSQFIETPTLRIFKPAGIPLVAMSTKQNKEEREGGRNGRKAVKRERGETEVLPQCLFPCISGFSGELPK